MSYMSVLNASQCPSTNVVTNPVAFEWIHHPASANNPEEYYRNDITYSWMYRYECPDMFKDIMNHTDKKYLLGTPIKQIVYYID